MTASVQDYTSTLLRADLRELVTSQNRWLFQSHGLYHFIISAPLTVGSSLLIALIRDLISLLECTYGPPEAWDKQNMNAKQAGDMLDGYLSKCSLNPSLLLGGIHQPVFLDMDTQVRLNSLLTALESAEGVYGNSTLLFLSSSSVLYSRLTPSETHVLQLWHQLRPLGQDEQVRHVPVFTQGSWKRVVMCRVHGSYVVCMLTHMDAPLQQFDTTLNEFKSNLFYARIELPMEPPVMALRLFAKRETLCMLYRNTKTQVVVMPVLRPGPEMLHKEIQGCFWRCFCDAMQSMQVAMVQGSGTTVTEYSCVRDGYRFYTKVDGVHQLFLLLGGTSLDQVAGVYKDVLKSVIQRTEVTLL